MSQKGRPPIAPIFRLLAKVQFNPENGCIEWQAAKIKGYSHFRISKDRQTSGHKAAWEIFRGPIAPGLQVDHRCKNTICVNVEHLRIVTIQENINSSNGVQVLNRQKTTCPLGHTYDTVYGKRKTRGCRACLNAANRKSRANKRMKI